MSYTPVSEFLRLIDFISSNGSNYSVSEDHLTLRISGIYCTSENVFDQIKTFVQVVEEERLGKCIIVGKILQDIDISDAIYGDVKEDQLALILRKQNNNQFYIFFTKEGFKKGVYEDGFIYTAKKVWVAEKFNDFSSIATDFQQWGTLTEPEKYDWEGLSDPRKATRNLTSSSDCRTPHDISPWLLRPNQNNEDSEILNIWKSAAAGQLSFSIPSEIRSLDSKVYAAFKGERSREVEISHSINTYLLECFDILHECAFWVYSNVQEAEIRHTLLNYHLAAEWANDEIWPNNIILKKASTSAHETYKLHLHSSSKELLKAYSEIKNSLQEEVSKVAENTRGLVSNLWRDFAVTAAVLALNYATQKNNLTSDGVKIIYTITAGFLILSLLITTLINSKYNKISQDNRDLWRQRLYPFIDGKNFSELVTNPISSSLKYYKFIVAIVAIIYILIASYLMYLALAA